MSVHRKKKNYPLRILLFVQIQALENYYYYYSLLNEHCDRLTLNLLLKNQREERSSRIFLPFPTDREDTEDRERKEKKRIVARVAIEVYQFPGRWRP